jgi:pSer/pThr/pTyr-binding forkhead associated (FHA) protein
VPFTLTVSNLSGRRPEFAFDAKEARLGRTADNDIVVKDPDASRSHCRVFQKDGRYFVEDLKSANGTQVNFSVISGTTVELKNGDTIGIGEVTFLFTAQTTPSTEIPQYSEPGDTAVRGGMGSTDKSEELKSTSFRPAYQPKSKGGQERERPTSRKPKDRAPTSALRDSDSVDEEFEQAEKIRNQKVTTRNPPLGPGDSDDDEGAGMHRPPPLGAKVDSTDNLPVPSSPVLQPPPLEHGVNPTERLRKANTVLTPKVLDDDGEPQAKPADSQDSVPPEPSDGAIARKSKVPGESVGFADSADIEPLSTKGGSTAEVPLSSAIPKGSALPVAQPPENERVRVRRGSVEPKDEEDSQIAEPTAAQKARVRRQANKTTAGRVAWQWSQLSAGARIAFVLATLAFLGGAGIFTYGQLAPPAKAIIPPEPSELVGNGQTLEYSFGLGDGVTYDRPDMKVFTFKANGATQLVGLLHYQARDVSKEEVSIAVNGFDLGFVPADGLDSMDRELEVVLPAGQVRRNEQNQITFDNVRNPPGKDPWRVWNVWLELLALPDASTEETLIAVKEDLSRAQKFYDNRDIGAESLFKAWKSYRDAWLKLESLPGHPEDLYMLARSQQAETRRLMDHRCKQMQLDVQRALAARRPDYDTARRVLKDMLRYFPTREHPCNGLVTQQLKDLSEP